MESFLYFNPSELHCHPKLSRTIVDIDGCQLHCKNCFSFLMPISASFYHMGIHSQNTQFIKNYLVLENYNYQKVLIVNQQKFISKDSIQQPFHLMYLTPTKCLKCGFRVGYYFDTVNIAGTKWLLRKIAVDLDLISLSIARYDVKIKQAFIQYLIDSTKECHRTFGRWTDFDMKIMQFGYEEDSLQKLLLETTNSSSTQKQQKCSQLKSTLKAIGFFDHRIDNLLQISEIVNLKSQQLQRKIKHHIPKLKGFVGQASIMQKKQSKQSKP